MLRGKTYTFIFFLTLAEGLLISINSPYLASLAGTDNVGLIYTLASLIALFGLTFLPHAVNEYGHKNSLYFLLALGTLAALGSALLSGSIALAAIIIYLVTPQISCVISDLYIDDESSRSERGKVVGTAFTIMNLAYCVGPLIAGYIAKDEGFKNLYFVAAVIFVLSAYFLGRFANKLPPIRLHKGKLILGLQHAWRRKDIRYVLFTFFLLQFFFSWMVIYTPLYLISKFAFSYSTLGVIFSIMLLPYVLFEYPLGQIADKKLGEKELLICGFVLIAFTTAIIPLVDSTSPLIWAVVLFGTRVGAAMVESMTATYFHKKVGEGNFDLLALFRDMRPLGYLIGPAIASLLFPNYLPTGYLFPILGVIMILGALAATQIKDTK